MSPTGYLVPLDGSVKICERFVVKGREWETLEMPPFCSTYSLGGTTKGS